MDATTTASIDSATVSAADATNNGYSEAALAHQAAVQRRRQGLQAATCTHALAPSDTTITTTAAIAAATATASGADAAAEISAGQAQTIKITMAGLPTLVLPAPVLLVADDLSGLCAGAALSHFSPLLPPLPPHAITLHSHCTGRRGCDR